MIEGQCECNFGYVETGLGTSVYSNEDVIEHKITQVYLSNGQLVFMNRIEDEEMNDLELRCARCGARATFVNKKTN